MANPQESEVRRSGNIPAITPDATEAVRQADRTGRPSDARGPIPPDQRPGHRPDRDQDKPDPAAFAAAMGIRSDDDVPAKSAQLWKTPLAVGVVGLGAALFVFRALRRRARRR